MTTWTQTDRDLAEALADRRPRCERVDGGDRCVLEPGHVGDCAFFAAVAPCSVAAPDRLGINAGVWGDEVGTVERRRSSPGNYPQRFEAKL